VTPAASRLDPRARAAAAPASTLTVPRMRRRPPSQALRAVWRRRGRNRVPRVALNAVAMGEPAARR
jgi:hypothetical protein